MKNFGHDDGLPDACDGLTDKERVVLYCLHEAQKELGKQNVPTTLLYGRVLEYVNISAEEFQAILTRLAGRQS